MTACGPLCAPMTGGAGPCPSLLVRAGVGRLWEALRYKASGRKGKQEKALALLWRLGGHFRPQCGRFQGLELALFRPTRFEIGAVFSQKPPESPL